MYGIFGKGKRNREQYIKVVEKLLKVLDTHYHL